MKIYKKVTMCRACSSKRLKKILAFPDSAIDGIYSKSYKAPLTLVFCKDCGQAQLKEIINPDLYKDYNFTSENISVVKAWCNLLSAMIFSEYKRRKDILEIGSGDGYVAKLLSKKFSILCIEPSDKLVKTARQNFKLKIIHDYFDENLILNKKFDIIIARHVMEHIEKLNEFVRKIIENIRADGTIIIEVPDLREILLTNNYANLFHEHINYFSPTNLSKLFEPYGFYPTKFLTNQVHGGAICIFFSRSLKNKLIIEDNVSEKNLDKFSKEFLGYKNKMKNAALIINRYKNVCGYGAANKTFKLLSLMNLRKNRIRYIFDRNKNLHGQTIPQFGVKIVDPSKIKKISPELLVIFATSYEDEILKELRLKYKYGNKFLSISGTPKIIKAN